MYCKSFQCGRLRSKRGNLENRQNAKYIKLTSLMCVLAAASVDVLVARCLEERLTELSLGLFVLFNHSAILTALLRLRDD